MRQSQKNIWKLQSIRGNFWTDFLIISKDWVTLWIRRNMKNVAKMYG